MKSFALEHLIEQHHLNSTVLEIMQRTLTTPEPKFDDDSHDGPQQQQLEFESQPDYFPDANYDPCSIFEELQCPEPQTDKSPTQTRQEATKTTVTSTTSGALKTALAFKPRRERQTELERLRRERNRLAILKLAKLLEVPVEPQVDVIELAYEQLATLNITAPESLNNASRQHAVDLRLVRAHKSLAKLLRLAGRSTAEVIESAIGFITSHM